MYELVQVGPRSYYINAPVKIGVYLEEENQVYLIDSGNDKDAGRKLRQLLEKQGWTLRAILTPILTQTTLAATSTFGSRPAARFTPLVWIVPLPAILCWSPLSSTVGFLPRTCGTSF